MSAPARIPAVTIRMIAETNKGGNEIYTFDAHSAPNLMQEVGRIRELTFRSAGGGTASLRMGLIDAMSRLDAKTLKEAAKLEHF